MAPDESTLRVGVPPGALEHTPCPLCGLVGEKRPRYRFAPFAIVRCTRCRLLHLDPRLSEAAMHRAYADGEYFEGGEIGYSSYSDQEDTLRRTFRHLLASMERRGMTGGRLLEIGCAYGFFLDEAATHFETRVGTDFSAAALARAEGRADELVQGGIESVAPSAGFDAVVCIHTIEHVYEPLLFARQIRERLAPGGWFVVATPDGGPFWRFLLGRRWPFFKVPEHVTFFERKTLPALLEASGFEALTPLPYRSLFTLGLVGEKLGLRLPAVLADRAILLPRTTLAWAGRVPAG